MNQTPVLNSSQKIEPKVSYVDGHPLVIVDTVQPKAKVVITVVRSFESCVQVTKEDCGVHQKSVQNKDMLLGAVGSKPK